MWAYGNVEELTNYDRDNLDDLIVVAAELLYEVKIYEWSVLNPVTFILVSILELAIGRTRNNTNASLKIWLMKILGKLGLSSRFTGVSTKVEFKGTEDKSFDLKNIDFKNFEKFGALKYSHYQTYGVERELDKTC